MFVTPAAQRSLDTASALFYERGITATGVDLIAERSGVAKTTMYAHFGSKDGLVAAYLRARSESARSYLCSELPTHASDPRERLLRMFDLLAESMDDPGFRGCPFIKAAAELCEADHPALAEIQAHRTWMRGHLTRLSQDFGARDAASLATAVLMLHDAAMVHGAIDGGGGVAARRARESAQSLIDAARV